MITVCLYIKDTVSLEYNRVELFNDEKISVNSSIQNVNDISKTFTDYSQTFTIPASKQNNKIFKHWYENSLSLENSFSTLIKADAYIELDTIPFRSGKIQLESCNIKDGKPQDYSITFIGALGSLKDKFNGLYLKDLTDTTYDFAYSGTIVKNMVTTPQANNDIMFPLISSNRYWNYGKGGVDDISLITSPIYYNELFPAIRLKSVLNMIENQFGINFDGTIEEPSTFLTDARFTNAYLWLKNTEEFIYKPTPIQITWTQGSSIQTLPYLARQDYKKLEVTITPTVAGISYNIILYKNGIEYIRISKTSIIGLQSFDFGVLVNDNSNFTVYIIPDTTITFNSTAIIRTYAYTGNLKSTTTWTKATNQTVTILNLSVSQYFPDIKIEDFFSGILKMFNLNCYSKDGINYTIRQIEEYYENGTIRDITKYIKTDNINLNRVKTYKKINFEYEKSDALINIGFKSANGIEYGSLFFDTNNDGEEYNIKLPFENLEFSNLNDKFQVGYSLKTDLQKYIPKPVILYDYFPQGTVYNANPFYFSTATYGNGVAYNDYKAFGQEYAEVDFPTIVATYSLNFNEQQSTLTNELITNSLYNQYYQNYLTNIFDSKARLIKVSGILPTSLLTTLKLNDRLIIRDKRYLINNMVIDLTTGEVQFELLTDNRVL